MPRAGEPGRPAPSTAGLSAALLVATMALTALASLWLGLFAPPPPAAAAPATAPAPHSEDQAASSELAPDAVESVDPLAGLLDEPRSTGEVTFPAGQGALVPLRPQEATARTPLRRYNGRSIVLLTDTRAEYAAELLGKLDSFILQAHSALGRVLEVQASPRPTQIIVFESQERYQEYAREHAPGLVNNGGYYDGGMRTVVTYRFNNSMQLYFHELVHAMMGELFNDHNFSRYTRRNWPIWFDEGMSEYLGSFEVQAAGIVAPSPNKGKLAYLANAMANNAFIDLKTLLRAPADRFSGASMNIYYAESWGLLDFLLSTPAHKAKVPQFFRRIRGGEDGLAAFKACFGADLDALDAAWRAHVQQMTRPQPGWVSLFSGESIDDWTVHEGGQWRAGQGEIAGTGDRNYNYLIKSEVPMTDFAYELDLNLSRGTAGLILGNNFHGEYPYYYLIDVARDAIMLRRAHSASRIEPVIQAYSELPLNEWVHLRVAVVDRVLRLSVDGREVLSARVDRDRYSLFGLYLYRARVRFRNILVRNEAGPRAVASTVPLTTPAAGGPAEPGAVTTGAPPAMTAPGPRQPAPPHPFQAQE